MDVDSTGEVWDRPIPLNAFDVRVDRIEVRNRWSDDTAEEEEPNLDWSIFLVPMPPQSEEEADGGPPNFVMIGHLLRITDEAVAQVRSHAYIRCFAQDGTPIGEQQFREFHAPGYIESVYDSCRRAVESTSAFMDLDLELPHISPLVELVTRGTD